jgi:hypothetical protein
MHKDLQYFAEHPDKYDSLSDADRANLMNGHSIEVKDDPDTTTPDTTAGSNADAQSSSSTEEDGSAAATNADGSDGSAATKALDEQLQAAREQALHWQQVAEQAQADLEKLSESTTSDGKAAASSQSLSEDIDELEDRLEDARESALLGDADAKLEVKDLRRQIRAKQDQLTTVRAVEAVQQQAESGRVAALSAAINAVAAKAFSDYPWLDHNRPEANQEAIVQVRAIRDHLIDKGTPVDKALDEAVNRVAELYGKSVKSASTDASALQKADEAIQKARAKVPSSLSSVPSSFAVPADEIEALRSLSPTQLQLRIAEMSRDEIDKILTKIV